jgi:hypothetical protein
MLDAELQRLRGDDTAIANLLHKLANDLALPLPPEPPFQVMSNVTTLHDRVYDMARMVGSLKRGIRDRILQQTLTADFPPQGDKDLRALE